MKKKPGKVSIILLAVLILALIGSIAYLIIDAADRELRERYAVVEYPMANQHIEWTYAGKGGFGK